MSALCNGFRLLENPQDFGLPSFLVTWQSVGFALINFTVAIMQLITGTILLANSYQTNETHCNMLLLKNILQVLTVALL